MYLWFDFSRAYSFSGDQKSEKVNKALRDGVNWYAYVGNDPVNFVDPLGLCSEEDGVLNNTTIGKALETATKIYSFVKENKEELEQITIGAIKVVSGALMIGGGTGFGGGITVGSGGVLSEVGVPLAMLQLLRWYNYCIRNKRYNRSSF